MSFSADNICFQVGKKTILDEVTLQIQPGEMLAVLGPNGAGKSSLLKIMAGEQRFFDGQLNLNGRSYSAWSANEIARMVGVLPQSSELMFPFSVAEVVMLGRLPHSTGRLRDREIVAQAMQLLDVSHLSEALYPALSGGEKQRVQLARVLTQIWEAEPAGDRYLLLDEPTSALDLSHQHQTLEVARRLAKQGTGVMAILHDLNLAAQYADRIVLLGGGRLVAEGAVDNVLVPEQIRELYDIEVEVMRHPSQDRPLVVTL
ncbi:heme ABC transporter ATP-binding protein [Aliamphritea ceti]|uniref:heme ABC transporter ATP-binding protein n=1 Tax=Aliamphritea ceti TaxID=1524258 RepID=UPI0021C47CC5|nr:heme ABC transporter ATP-binding protein [Aliamphritea ceti]